MNLTKTTCGIIIAKILIAFLVPIAASQFCAAQWSNFYFTDAWGDKTDDLAARSAYTKSARQLPFPYQDRRMALIVDDCNDAWVRFNDGIVFGELSGLKVRVDGENIPIFARSSSDNRTDIYLRNARLLISLLGAANKAEFLIPIYGESPARFNLNMNGSMRAVGKVCDFEKLAREQAEADKRRAISRARIDSLRRIEAARIDSLRRIEAARIDSARQAAEEVKSRLDNQRNIFCEQDFVKNWVTRREFSYRSSILRNRVRLHTSHSKKRIELHRESWDNLSLEERKIVAQGAFFRYMCEEIYAPKFSHYLHLDENNQIHIYSQGEVIVSMNIKTGAINY